METIEGNILIAKYMGYTVWSDSSQMLPASLHHITESKVAFYNQSWARLMPVVEKISENYDISISSVGMWACFISRQDVFDSEITSRGGFEPMIMNVWLAVVDFIKWYNNNIG